VFTVHSTGHHADELNAGRTQEGLLTGRQRLIHGTEEFGDQRMRFMEWERVLRIMVEQVEVSKTRPVPCWRSLPPFGRRSQREFRSATSTRPQPTNMRDRPHHSHKRACVGSIHVAERPRTRSTHGKSTYFHGARTSSYQLHGPVFAGHDRSWCCSCRAKCSWASATEIISFPHGFVTVRR
jgi:hypothetical protein